MIDMRTLWMCSLCDVLDQIAQYDLIHDYDRRAGAIFEAMGLAHKLGYHVGIRNDPDLPDMVRESWPVAYIVLPTGQVSWHLEAFTADWDGHTVDQKYVRIRDYVYGMRYGQ